MKRVKLPVPRERIAEFCRKWHVIEFNLFGSVLRDDFRAESDVDVLLRFAPGHGIGFDNRVEMEDELAAIFGRKVDLVEHGAIRNPFRRQSIMNTREVIYAAARA